MERFARLRELLAAPHVQSWQALLRHLMDWPEGTERQIAIHYAREHLAEWLNQELLFQAMASKDESWKVIGELVSMEMLVQALSEGPLHARWKSAGLLGQQNTDEIIDFLQTRLGVDDKLTQHWAIIALGECTGLKACQVLHAFSSDDSSLRRAVARSIGLIGSQIPSTQRKVLLHMLVQAEPSNFLLLKLQYLIQYQPRSEERNQLIQAIFHYAQHWPQLLKSHLHEQLTPLIQTAVLLLKGRV